MKYLILLVLLFSSVATAGEIVLHLESWHTKDTYKKYGTQTIQINGSYYTYDTVRETKYNNVNTGIGYVTDAGVAFGTYQNSYNRQSWYLTKTLMFTPNFGVMGGVVTGYEERLGNAVQPFGAGIVRFHVSQGTSAVFTVMPPTSQSAGVVTLSLSFDLK